MRSFAIAPDHDKWLAFYHSPDYQEVITQVKALALDIVSDLKQGDAYSVGELSEEVGNQLGLRPDFIRLTIFFALQQDYRTFLSKLTVGYEVFVTLKEESGD